MESKFYEEDKLLEISILEEIDHHYANKMRRRIDSEIEKYIPKKIVFDFNNVTFMDSAGIGMLLGRYKLSRVICAEIELINVASSVKRILEMCGITRIIKVIDAKKMWK